MVNDEEDEIISDEEIATYRKIQREMKNGEIACFDEVFPDEVFEIPRDQRDPRVKVLALWDYCKRHKKIPSELSMDEMALFIEWDEEK
jgi:hypothetical protein